MLSGRNDGINGYGLCVTMSGSWDPVPEDANEPNGLHYAMAIRALLEGCKTLAEALELLERMPIGGGVNIIVAHRSGTAALVEVAGRKRAIKTIDADTADQYLLAINHFTMMGISEHHENSTTRYDAFMSWLRANTGRINADAFKAFLAREYPQGVCGFISEFQLGTLWSMVFDVSEGTVEIRFGPPPHNEWHSFTLGGPVGVSEYKALFPRKKA
jgi:predicted choloylglycine hydrolase